jgi:MFS family permease
VHSFQDVLFWRLTSRIADAPQHPIGNALISQSFPPERRGLALAINSAGSNLGTVAVPIIGGFLIAAFGWRSTLFLVGALGMVVGGLLIWTLEEPRLTSRRSRGTVRIGTEIWALLKHREALLLLISHVLGAGGRGLGVATLYVPLYLTQVLQVDKVHLGMFMTVMMAGSVIGPLLAGPISDRVGRKPILLIDYVLACVCYVGLLMVGANTWTLIAVLIITGIAVYSEGSIMQTALADVADKTSMDMLFGLYFTIGAVIGAPWALLLGLMVDHYGFPAAFATMAGSQVLAGLCVLPVRLRRTRRLARA